MGSRADEHSSYFEVAVRRGWIKPTNQARSRETCDRIMVAAYMVFSKTGYRDTNVSDITKAAGCSVGIFYKRFRDKEGLFYALQYQRYEKVHQMIDRLVDVYESKRGTEDILSRFVYRTLEAMVANAGWNKAQVELSLKDRRVLDARRANDRYISDRLMDFLVYRDELPDTPELRDKLHFVVRVVLGTITNFILFGSGPYAATDKRVVDNLAEVIVGFLHEEQQRLRRV
jgi:AcrR family transcriptional regulator